MCVLEAGGVLISVTSQSTEQVNSMTDREQPRRCASFTLPHTNILTHSHDTHMHTLHIKISIKQTHMAWLVLSLSHIHTGVLAQLQAASTRPECNLLNVIVRVQ